MSNRAITHICLAKSPRKGTEVARFLRRHSPTPSDFGWPGYPNRCCEVEVAVMMRHVATSREGHSFVAIARAEIRVMRAAAIST